MELSEDVLAAILSSFAVSLRILSCVIKQHAKYAGYCTVRYFAFLKSLSFLSLSPVSVKGTDTHTVSLTLTHTHTSCERPRQSLSLKTLQLPQLPDFLNNLSLYHLRMLCWHKKSQRTGSDLFVKSNTESNSVTF